MPRLAAEHALPEPSQIRRQFERAARSFASASFLHDEARRRLLERLDAFRLETGTFVDLGTALGGGAAALAARFPAARVVALDSSVSMLERASAGCRVLGDAARLPFPDRSLELIFANLLLPWMAPEQLFAEARRTLSSTGMLVFSTLGPDTLAEIRRAWHTVDEAIHVHAFWDLQTLGDLSLRAGLEEPVLDVERIKVSYTGLSSLIRDLRGMGATNLAAGRRRGLTGRALWQGFVEALWRDQGKGEKGRFGATVELIMGQAFGSRAAAAERANGEVRVPLDQLRRPRPSSSQ